MSDNRIVRPWRQDIGATSQMRTRDKDDADARSWANADGLWHERYEQRPFVCHKTRNRQQKLGFKQAAFVTANRPDLGLGTRGRASIQASTEPVACYLLTPQLSGETGPKRAHFRANPSSGPCLPGFGA